MPTAWIGEKRSALLCARLCDDDYALRTSDPRKVGCARCINLIHRKGGAAQAQEWAWNNA